MLQTGWLWGYFLLASVAVALWAFPDWRQALASRCFQWWARACVLLQELVGQLGHQASAAPAQVVGHLGGSTRVARQWWRRWGGWTLGGSALLGIPVALALGWSVWGSRNLEGFDDRIVPHNDQVAYLLQGEHLVPPPPLPPEVFTTAEVDIVRPMLATADRRWDQLDPAFVQVLLRIFKIMKDEHGYDMALLEGWRSPERQALLATRGVHVTHAGAGQSYHQYGVAADCAFYRNGKLVITEKDPWAMRGYQLYGEVAERVGMTWGGRWQMMDLGHVEWRKPEVGAIMRAARRR